MSTQELRDYIAKEKKSGKSRPEIVKTLLANGWQQADIDLAYTSLTSGVPLPPATQTPGIKPFGELLRLSWSIFRHRLWSFIGIAIIPIAFLVVGLLVYLGATTTSSLFSSPTAFANQISDRIAAISIIWLVYFIIELVLIFLGNLALYYLVAHWNEAVGFREAYAYAWKNFGRGLWVQLLVGLAVYGGTALLGVPGIIASLALMFSLCIFVTEGTGGFGALIRSHALVYHRWWAIFLHMFVLGLIGAGAQMVLWLPSFFTLGTVWMVYALVWQIFVAIFIFQLYQSAQATAVQQSFAHKKVQYQIYAVIGGLVIVGFLVAIAISLAVGLSGATTNFNFNINSTL